MYKLSHVAKYVHPHLSKIKLGIINNKTFSSIKSPPPPPPPTDT